MYSMYILEYSHFHTGDECIHGSTDAQSTCGGFVHMRELSLTVTVTVQFTHLNNKPEYYTVKPGFMIKCPVLVPSFCAYACSLSSFLYLWQQVHLIWHTDKYHEYFLIAKSDCKVGHLIRSPSTAGVIQGKLWSLVI